MLSSSLRGRRGPLIKSSGFKRGWPNSNFALAFQWICILLVPNSTLQYCEPQTDFLLLVLFGFWLLSDKHIYDFTSLKLNIAPCTNHESFVFANLAQNCQWAVRVNNVLELFSSARWHIWYPRTFSTTMFPPSEVHGLKAFFRATNWSRLPN